MRLALIQARAEVGMTLRQGESMLVALGIPVLLLVFFSLVHVLPTGTRHPVDFLAPGVLALAVMSTAMVSLSIATGFERGYGVLKRLGTTPLTRPALVAAKTLSVLALEVVQAVVLVPVALGLGWHPGGAGVGTAVGGAVGAVAVGTAAFSGIGLVMAGTLRPQATLALANGVYLMLLLLGGMVIPLAKLPGALRALARVLPAAALSGALSGTFGAGGIPGRDWIVLGLWAVAAPLAAAALFRWE